MILFPQPHLERASGLAGCGIASTFQHGTQKLTVYRGNAGNLEHEMRLGGNIEGLENRTPSGESLSRRPTDREHEHDRRNTRRLGRKADAGDVAWLVLETADVKLRLAGVQCADDPTIVQSRESIGPERAVVVKFGEIRFDHVQPAEPIVKEQQQWHRSMKRTPG